MKNLLLSLSNSEVCSYGDGMTTFACAVDFGSVATWLELDSPRAVKDILITT